MPRAVWRDSQLTKDGVWQRNLELRPNHSRPLGVGRLGGSLALPVILLLLLLLERDLIHSSRCLEAGNQFHWKL